MKVLRISSAFLMAMLAFVFFACQKDAKSPDLTSNAGKGTTADCGGTYTPYLSNSGSTGQLSAYALLAAACYQTTNPNFEYSPGSTNFEWKIQFPKGSQDVSHFNIILPDCVLWTDVEAAYAVTKDAYGNDVVNCIPVGQTYVSDPSQICFDGVLSFKFDFGSKSDVVTYGIVLKSGLGGKYVESSTATTHWYVKSGSKSGCCDGWVAGPACPDGEDANYCNLSQGYWFAKPQTVWCESVALGSKTYTQDDGKAIWNTSNKWGVTATKRAFTQYSAIYLDQQCQKITLPDYVTAAMTTIEGILGNIQITATNVQPSTKNGACVDTSLTAAQRQALVDAAGVISAYIQKAEKENCPKG